LIKRLAERKITAFGMDLMPRLGRAQSMDALTSQASVAGYKAALIAACGLGRFFPMMTTAGAVAPARVLVLARASRVAAIATAAGWALSWKPLDIRHAVKEEVQAWAQILEVALPGEFGAAGGMQRSLRRGQAAEQEMLRNT
jgi:NAD(P) transhydrogenase subunit alpha